jgi:hypothetical protein
MTWRVAQWSVGGVGRHALRALVRSADFDLVGVYTHSPERAGRDAGELAGLAVETGVRATGDAGAVLATRPDCVVFTSVGETRRRRAVGELAEILRAGVNVVSSSMMDLVYAPAAEQRTVAALTEACAAGRATLFTGGLDPGFSGDALPVAAFQVCERVDVVRVQELADYGAHHDPAWAVPYGFGQPEGAPAPILEPGVPTLFWGGMVRLLADALGVELDGTEEFCERWFTPAGFDVPMGRIDAGTLAAVRFGVAGIVAGVPRLFAEHVTRTRPEAAPDWPMPPAGTRSLHRVVVTGSPSLTLDLHLHAGEQGASPGLQATAMRLVNAIPAVVRAEPGIVGALDLALGLGRRLLAPREGPPARRPRRPTATSCPPGPQAGVDLS